MPKIKKFNLKLSLYQIQQNLRRSKFPFTDETLHELDLLCQKLKDLITPAVYFETFRLKPSDKNDGKNIVLNNGIQIPVLQENNAVAFSVVISTLGAGADDFVAEYVNSSSINNDNGLTLPPPLVSSVISQASEEVKRFAWKIIMEEEIADEKCVLSDRRPLTDIKLLESIKDMLAKIEVFPTGNGLKPTYSFVEYAFWLPATTRKKKI